MDILTKAFAKINLHLEVLNKRPDGYHNVFSLMARVGLFDLLKLVDLRVTNEPEGPVSVEIVPAGGPYIGVIKDLPVEKNLVTRAARAYLQKTGLSGAITVSIEKNIPAGAGLGGGSCDAAAVLKMMNDNAGLFNSAGISHQELISLGAGLGADIPFCLTGGFALCEGIGEVVQPLVSGLKHSVLIAFDDIHVDTAQAYRSLNRNELSPLSESGLNERRHSLIRGIAAGDLGSLKKVVTNHFEQTVFQLHPGLETIRDRIVEEGADFAAMTGSGSGIIGLFREAQTALRARNNLAGSVGQVLITEFL